MKKSSVKFFMIKNINIVIPVVIATLLSILAYFFNPSTGYDLNSYYGWLDKLAGYNTKDVIYMITYRGEIIIMFYFYIIAKIGIYSLLQVLPTFIFYFIMFFIIFDYSKINNISIKKTLIVCLIFVSLYQYVFIVSGVRCGLAYCIFIFALYLDYIKKKKNVVILLIYIIPLFIHTSIIILLFFRLLEYIKNKKITIGIMIALGIFIMFPSLLVSTMGIINATWKNNEFFTMINEKIIFYTVQDNISMNLQYFFRILQTSLLIATHVYICKKVNIETNNGYNNFLNIVSIFTISCTMYYSMYMRFVDLIVFLMLVRLLALLKRINSIDKRLKACLYLVYLAFIVGGIRIQIPVFINMYFK